MSWNRRAANAHSDGRSSDSPASLGASAHTLSPSHATAAAFRGANGNWYVETLPVGSHAWWAYDSTYVFLWAVGTGDPASSACLLPTDSLFTVAPANATLYDTAGVQIWQEIAAGLADNDTFDGNREPVYSVDTIFFAGGAAAGAGYQIVAAKIDGSAITANANGFGSAYAIQGFVYSTKLIATLLKSTAPSGSAIVCYNSDFTVNWSQTFAGVGIGPPCLSSTALYAVIGSELYKFNPNTGGVVWHKPALYGGVAIGLVCSIWTSPSGYDVIAITPNNNFTPNLVASGFCGVDGSHLWDAVGASGFDVQRAYGLAIGTDGWAVASGGRVYNVRMADGNIVLFGADTSAGPCVLAGQIAAFYNNFNIEFYNVSAGAAAPTPSPCPPAPAPGLPSDWFATRIHHFPILCGPGPGLIACNTPRRNRRRHA
jgi:hypothetical protein